MTNMDYRPYYDLEQYLFSEVYGTNGMNAERFLPMFLGGVAYQAMHHPGQHESCSCLAAVGI